MRTIGALIFPGFELLDVFGPMEMFGLMKDDYALTLIAEQAGPVASNQTLSAHADISTANQQGFDILFIPGGVGTRNEVENTPLLDWITQAAAQTEYVLTVCTGSALLARTGFLDGQKATTNKAAFHWATSQGPKVDWQKQARWVQEDKIFTSSGVSAGMDMALAAIAHMQGQTRAEEIAVYAEYDWHQDATWDPFAKIHGLV